MQCTGSLLFWGTMDGVKWSAADVRGTATAVEPWWALLTAGVPGKVVADLSAPPPLPATPASSDVEASLAALSRAGRELVARGYGMSSQTGVVEGVYAGAGGVPKLPIEVAEVTVGGVVADCQRTRKHHGRVWQALCLWSADVIDVLRAEGHPVYGGACGENLTVRGIDWSALQPGVRVRIGTVLAEISLPTIPCKQIRPFFAGPIRRVDHDCNPGFSRWYASVLEPGRIAAGDRVEVEPAS